MENRANSKPTDSKLPSLEDTQACTQHARCSCPGAGEADHAPGGRKQSKASSCNCSHNQSKASSCGCSGKQSKASTCGCKQSKTCGCSCHEEEGEENRSVMIVRIVAAALCFAFALLAPFESWLPADGALAARFAAFLLPYLIAGYDVLARAAKNLVRGKMFDESFLMSIATIGAFLLVLFPEGSAHFAEGAAVMLLYQLGELMQDYATDKSRDSIKELMDISPEYANILQDGCLAKVSPSEVQVGQTFIVLPGERIALDGEVIEGESSVDTSALTGESLPLMLKPGSQAISGCINLSGRLSIRAQREYRDSSVARILELVEESSHKKANTESFITRFARMYTPLVVAAACLLAVLPPMLFGAPFAEWLERGLVFLVASCPCALVISIPLSFFAGLGAASRRGILVKGGTYLEALTQVRTLVFDKTGTLTTGSFEATSILPSDGISADEVLRAAALAEQFSTHPLALSVRNAWKGALDSSVVSNVREYGGRGVAALVDGKRTLVGNSKLMQEEGILHAGGNTTSEAREEAAAFASENEARPLPQHSALAMLHEPLLKPLPQDSSLAHADEPLNNQTKPSSAETELMVAQDGRLIGSILVGDALKPQAREALSQLRKNGADTLLMLTGDSPAAARRIAEKLELDGFEAGLLPQEKTALLESILAGQKFTEASCASKGKAAFASPATDRQTSPQEIPEHQSSSPNEAPAAQALSPRAKADKLKSRRKVAFVGDGINDAPSLMRADVGIAMGALGSDAAIEAADVVLMDDRLSGLSEALLIARKTMRIVRQNIALTLSVKLVVLLLAAGGLASMWIAVVADVGVALAAILNALRIMAP